MNLDTLHSHLNNDMCEQMQYIYIYININSNSIYRSLTQNAAKGHPDFITPRTIHLQKTMAM